jgi:CRISPR-associated exonuclease Cas4
VWLESDTLGLKGVVDVVITTADNPAGEPELIPVDYKLSDRQMGIHFKLQLLAYGLLLAESRKLPVRRGFLYAIPRRQATEVRFTPSLRRRLTDSLTAMQYIVSREIMPQPAKQRANARSANFVASATM